MRFGGHETFHIREGWLHKGLKLLVEEPRLLTDQYSADWLGVGRNMAKSIRYWLVATDLATPSLMSVGSELIPPEPTELGRLVWKHDPYFLESVTWWALHINLVNSKEYAYSWYWFFNHFTLPRFDRGICIDSLLSYLRFAEKRVPSHKTLQRDIACLLSSYAQAVPPEPSDPEDAAECPLAELGLLSYFRASGTYRANLERKTIEPELLGYALARSFPSRPRAGAKTDVTLREATTEPGGPGRAFLLDEEGLFDIALRFEAVPGSGIALAGQAGERLLRIPALPRFKWLERFYSRRQEGSHAA